MSRVIGGSCPRRDMRGCEEFRKERGSRIGCARWRNIIRHLLDNRPDIGTVHGSLKPPLPMADEVEGRVLMCGSLSEAWTARVLNISLSK